MIMSLQFTNILGGTCPSCPVGIDAYMDCIEMKPAGRIDTNLSWGLRDVIIVLLEAKQEY